MKNNKKMLTTLLAVSMTAGLVACSGGNDASPGTTGSASDGQSEKKQTITWFEGTWESPVPEPKSDAVAKINEKFNVDFQPQYIPWDTYEEKLAVKMASGDLPDVIGMEEVNSNYVKWAQDGAFLPLEDLLDDYDTMKIIPPFVRDSLTVDGHIYGVPTYFSAKGGKKMVIRQDWLDKLDLTMPTNYEELKQVAIAFAKQDPDGNGKDDTLGLGLAKNIYYDPQNGAYYHNDAWYHKNENGQYIPGMISEANKEKIQFLIDLSKEGAISKDWAVTTYKDVFKEFNAGKVGIWYEQPGVQSANGIYPPTLMANAPEAVVAPIPPFISPDGSEGLKMGSGWYRMYLVSSKLKDQPEKVAKILEMIDYMRGSVPLNEQNPQNEFFDWKMGGEGEGYMMADGLAQKNPEKRSMTAPAAYILDFSWAENDVDLEEFIELSPTQEGKDFNRMMTDMLKSTKWYIDPSSRIIAPGYMEKKTELKKYITDETTKMIIGQRSIDEWDKMVEEWLAKGGQEAIDEVNKAIADSNLQGEWQ
ncbi:extracellular solute-binding protein [Paenibacillus chungangensis]|uniref:Extracellular solute-binding protein n=1 Tax=Paenibacillus chungangensis TaxID=696535 RepID=A0ABW3HSA1_9BACL